MNLKKIFGAIIGTFAFFILVLGATYAWFTWSSNNTIINGTTGCFTINYLSGTAINGEYLGMSTSYKGGVNTTVTINIAATCTIKGTADIILTTTNVTYTTGLKYAVVMNNNVVKREPGSTELAEGDITGTGTMTLAKVTLSQVSTGYTVYIWLDGAEAGDEAIGSTYSGYIHAVAEQTHS